jgi:hypothetical protein
MRSACFGSRSADDDVSARSWCRRLGLVLAPCRARLRDAGHETIALDLPADDPDAGLSAYVELAIGAAQGHDDVIVVAQSMGAFTAVPVCTRLAALRLVLLNAMIPAPGETADDWCERRPAGGKLAAGPHAPAATQRIRSADRLPA